jgi:hypothetical protein
MDERNDDQPDLDTGPTPRTALDAARDSEQYAPRASDTAPTRIPDGIRLESPAPARRRSSAPAPVEDPTIDVGRLGIPDAPGAVRPVSAGIASRTRASGRAVVASSVPPPPPRRSSRSPTRLPLLTRLPASPGATASAPSPAPAGRPPRPSPRRC